METNSLTIIRYMLSEALNFALKDFFKRKIDVNQNKENRLLLVLGNCMSGGMAGFITHFLAYHSYLASIELDK